MNRYVVYLAGICMAYITGQMLYSTATAAFYTFAFTVGFFGEGMYLMSTGAGVITISLVTTFVVTVWIGVKAVRYIAEY